VKTVKTETGKNNNKWIRKKEGGKRLGKRQVKKEEFEGIKELRRFGKAVRLGERQNEMRKNKESMTATVR